MVNELHDREHELIGERIDDISIQNKDHENRLILLEKTSHVRDVQIGNLVKSIDTLISWIKWGLAFFVPATISFLIWLLQQQLSK